jgi:hypothetical protein
MCLARAVAHEGQGEEPVLPWTLDENRDLGATRLGFTPGAARARKLIFGPRRFTGRLSEAPDPPPALRGSSPRPTKYTTRAWSKVATTCAPRARCVWHFSKIDRLVHHSLGQVGFGIRGVLNGRESQAGHLGTTLKEVSASSHFSAGNCRLQ